MTDLIARASAFAMKKHEGIFRPNAARTPYYVHCRQVAELVEQSGGTEVEIAAALLHDTVEDTDATIEDIRKEFGDDVACIVEGLTDPPGLEGYSTLNRKRFQAERVRNESDSVKRDKLADQTCNLRDLADDPPIHWTLKKSADYITGAELIAKECRGVSAYLDEEFRKAYQSALEAHALQT